MTTTPSKELETFVNPQKDRDYKISMRIPEFTCLCPKTGQPDFATFGWYDTPEEGVGELKSLKLYVWSFRETGAFHEAITNQILDDLVKATDPRWMKVRVEFMVRGGIYTDVTVEHHKK